MADNREWCSDPNVETNWSDHSARRAANRSGDQPRRFARRLLSAELQDNHWHPNFFGIRSPRRRVPWGHVGSRRHDLCPPWKLRRECEGRSIEDIGNVIELRALSCLPSGFSISSLGLGRAHCDRGDRAGSDRPVGRRHHSKHYHHSRDGCCGNQPSAGVEATDLAINRHRRWNRSWRCGRLDWA